VKCSQCAVCVDKWSIGDDATSSVWHKNDCPLILQQECGNIPMRIPLFLNSNKTVHSSSDASRPHNFSPMTDAGVSLPSTTSPPYKSAPPILPAPTKSIFTTFSRSKFQNNAMHTGHGDICTKIQNNNKKLSVFHLGYGNIIKTIHKKYNKLPLNFNDFLKKLITKRSMTSCLHSCFSPSADQASDFKQLLQSQRRLRRQKQRRRLKRLRKKLLQ